MGLDFNIDGDTKSYEGVRGRERVCMKEGETWLIAVVSVKHGDYKCQAKKKKKSNIKRK